MVNDSVREELQTKIGAPVPRAAEIATHTITELIPVQTSPAMAIPKREIPRPAPPLKRATNPLGSPKTSPTLVEFQSKNQTIPDWRLQLQNSVRQRKGSTGQRTDAMSEGSQTRLITNGANALKAELVENERLSEPVHSNPKIANALKRIDESRKAFLPTNPRKSAKKAAVAPRNYPFDVVAPTESGAAHRSPNGRPGISDTPKPTLVPTFRIDKKKYDTNKLPPIAEDPIAAPNSDQLPAIEIPKTAAPALEPGISIQVSKPATGDLILTAGYEIEDLAPISMRFNAALFDLMIGAFGSFALLSPIVLMGGNWLSIAGIAAFSGVWAAAMFLYMTLAIGMYGKTLGMRMFGLELIDAEENDYPTFHQAAVHSAVFLLTLPFLGAGFLPMIFNEEQRAAHDLAAGTMIVTEF